MRGIIISSFALAAGLTIFLEPTTPARTAPFTLHKLDVAAAATMVRQRCGEGMKRAKAWQDKNGAWHGACVPKHAAGKVA